MNVNVSMQVDIFVRMMDGSLVPRSSYIKFLIAHNMKLDVFSGNEAKWADITRNPMSMEELQRWGISTALLVISMAF